LNWLWNHPKLSLAIPWFLPYTLLVYLAGSSGVALLLLWWALRAGRLTTADVGLGADGWTAPRRLFGLAVVLAVAYGGFATLGPGQPGGPPPATWGEYCFWFVALLSASQAELLVFLTIGFCLVRRGLEHAGRNRWVAGALAAVLASVAFGLYHYSHEPRWHAYVFGLMPEMFTVILFFLATRNFFLTLLLHNAFAAIGFTTEAHSGLEPLPLEYFTQEPALAFNLVAFAVPFLVCHWIDWYWQPKREERTED
jgi:hypothetical protein